MKKLLLTFLLISGFVTAQNQRFIYEYKFIADSTNRENISRELMYLDISKNSSTYYSRDVFVRDSVMKAEIEKQVNSGNFNINVKSSARGKVNYKVTKDYVSNKIYLLTKVASDSYKVLEDRNFEWKILPKKQKIGEFEAQKAVTEFAGRKWTAWFSEELPFNDGPYKFRGLPGLIVKLEDATQSHVFELKGSTKFTPLKEGDLSSNSSSGTRIMMLGDSFSNNKEGIEIDREKYKKVLIEERKDPAKSLKMMSSGNGFAEGQQVKMIVKDQNGNDVSWSEIIKNQEEIAKEAIKRNNNLLELDLLQ